MKNIFKCRLQDQKRVEFSKPFASRSSSLRAGGQLSNLGKDSESERGRDNSALKKCIRGGGKKEEEEGCEVKEWKIDSGKGE